VIILYNIVLLHIAKANRRFKIEGFSSISERVRGKRGVELYKRANQGQTERDNAQALVE